MFGIDAAVWSIIWLSIVSNAIVDLVGETGLEYGVFYFKDWMAGEASAVDAACFAVDFQGTTIQQIVARAGEITASNLECMKQYYLASQAGASI